MLYNWVSSRLCMEFSFCFNIVSLSLSFSPSLFVGISYENLISNILVLRELYRQLTLLC